MIGRSRSFCRVLIALVLGIPAMPVTAFEWEMAPLAVNDSLVTAAPTSVTFLRPFSAVPVVISLATTEGSDPANLRITNVTTTGFSIIATEPSANDGPHAGMRTAYLAIEPGNHTLPDGTRVQAYRVQTSATVSRLLGSTWVTLPFATGFASPPAVLADLQTANNETASPPATSATPFLATAIRNVGTGSLQYAIERVESTTGTVSVAETIGIVAITPGVVTSFSDQTGTTVTLQSVRSTDTIRGFNNGCFPVNWNAPFATTPIAVASQNRRDGNNGGWLRRCDESATAIGLTVDEDIDTDSERSHTAESAGVVGASAAFHANFAVEFNLSKTVQPVRDAVNGDADPFAIPGSVVQYTVGLSNAGNGRPDANSTVITDTLPDTLALCVTTACQPGGVIELDDSGSPTPSEVTLGAVRYSNNAGATYDYTPNPDADGFDAAINAIEITLVGIFASVGAGGPPRLSLRFSARVR